MYEHIDIHIGKKIRQQRVIKGLSQSKLGACLDVSFQQVQKYERGVNSISATKLYLLAEALDCSPSEFYKGLSLNASDYENPEDFDNQTEILNLVRSFNSIEDKHLRHKITDMISSLANSNK